MQYWFLVSVRFVVVINSNLLFLPLFVTVWQGIISSSVVASFVSTGPDGRVLALCADNHDGNSIMDELSDIVLQYSALRSLKNVSKNLLMITASKH